MLDICLLGTGGMMPLPYRFLTSLYVRYNGRGILIDCGEATQITLNKQGWSFKDIDLILITHFHADHISGLPGFLLMMGNADRREPVNIVGPKGLRHVVSSLLVVAPRLPFEVICTEIGDEEYGFDMLGLHFKAFLAEHKVTCYGYSISLDRIGKFDPDKARSLGIPVNLWNRLQHGEDAECGGNVYTSDMVLGPPRKGIKLTYCTDSRPIDRIADNAFRSDLFICEGMYGEDGMEGKAIEKTHMTMEEAACLAEKAEVKELWLTHYSPSMNRPQDFRDKVQRIFPNTVVPKDRRTVTLKFEED